MRKKKISIDIIVIVLLVIMLTVLGCALGSSYHDISKLRADLAEKNLKENINMHGKLISQLFSSCLNEVEGVAAGATALDINDVSALYRIIQGHNDVFGAIGFIDLEGNTICGGEFALDNIQNEPFYGELLEGRGVISPGLYTDQAGNRGFLFFAPVMQEEQAKLILVGNYTETAMIQKLDTGEYFDAGCICIISDEGDYIIGGASFDTILGGKERNHFTHVGTGPSKELTDAISMRSPVNVDYKYAGQEYEAYYVPLSINDWYLSATVIIGEDRQDSVLTVKSQILLALLSLFACAWIVSVIFLLRHHYQSTKVIYRHELIQECDKSISFEMTFKPYTLRFFGDIKDVIGTDPGVLVGDAVYDIYDWVHEDDASVRGRVKKFFEGEDETFSTEVRIRNIKGNYGWYRVVGILHRKRMFVGKITNVDEELTEEHNLMQRAENDLLTGVLNKKTMEKRISLMIKNRGREYVIFYMVDLDNFKNVNDILGHIYGDQAIIETAQVLNKVFSDQDCIGRLGGDEFAVCVTYNAFDEQNLLDFIKKKGEKICQANRRTYTDGASEVSITSSVGVAYAPNMGESFEELYVKADKALYYSKKHGKDGYHIYTEEDQ